ARVWDLLERAARLVRPELKRLLRVRAEGDHRLQLVGQDGVVERVPPLRLGRVGEQCVCARSPAWMQGVGEGVHAQIRAGQSELREETLDALARIADKRPMRDP